MIDLIQNEELAQQLRKEVRQWAKEKEQKFLYQVARLGLVETGQLYESLKSKVKVRQGFTEKITYSFARQGIFQELGVGRGENRKAREWISAALDSKDMDELADIVANIMGDEAIEPINTIAFRN